MNILPSNINPQTPAFLANADHHRALAAELRNCMAQTQKGGSPRAHQRHDEQGKLFVRERINRLLDPGSPVLEL